MKLNKLKIKGFDIDIIDHENSHSTYWIEKELNSGGYDLDNLHISENDTIIDIGTNTGIFAIVANKKFGCKVIGFEPVKSIYENALINVKINDTKGIEIHNSAITNKEGDIIYISLDEGNSGGSSKFKNVNPTVCKTETLDKYIKENESSLKMLKIDCEGGEYEIIPSIIEHLNKFDYIAIEYHKYNEEQNPVDLHNMIKENFKGKLIHNDPNFPVYW